MIRRFFLACGLFLLAGSPLVAQQWATRMFETTEHDFGTVARGAKVEYRFVLSNIFLEDVHVLDARSSCGCTSLRIENPSLKTYAQGAIVAIFNTTAFQGQHGATVTVVIDKPFYAEVQLHVSGFIRSDVQIEPGSVQMGQFEQGSRAEQKVTVSYSGRSDWKILDVRGTDKRLSAELRETGRNDGQAFYELTVQADGNMPAGYLNDQIMLVTNDPQSPQIPLVVEGRVLAPVTVSPSSLFMGVVQPGQKVTKQLVVKGSKPFRILSVTCDDDSFVFDTSSDSTPKMLHLVPVSFLAGSTSGKVNRTIRIETDLGKSSRELPAYAVVADK